MSFVLKNRPHYGPRQVRTPRGIKRGNILEHHIIYGRILVLSSPERDESPFGGESLTFRAIVLDGLSRGRVEEIYLSDSGVVPYNSGMWNPTHHLERTGTKRLTEGEIKQIEQELAEK